MTRSRKKHCFTWVSKKWDRFKQKAYRRSTKMQCDEFVFDPDKDWEEGQEARKDWGTRFGWNVPPDPDDSQWKHESYNKGLRK